MVEYVKKDQCGLKQLLDMLSICYVKMLPIKH